MLDSLGLPGCDLRDAPVSASQERVECTEDGHAVAKISFLSLEGNVALKILNLSWNGIGNEGALALGEALKVNNVLVHLDISNNQINNEGAKKLCRGLEVNGKLKILKVK